MKKVFLFTILFLMLTMVLQAHADENTEKWNEFKKQHFIIYYQNAPTSFVEAVEESAERYYSRICSDIGFHRYDSWTFDDRASIYIYDNAEHYKTSGAAEWSHGIASPKNKVIHTFPTAHGFFDSTLPHELGHIIFREYIGYKTIIPIWFEEGIAMYQEQAKRWGAHDIVKTAIENGDFMSLTELSAMKLGKGTQQNMVNLFYAESASIVNYMITELGEYRFKNFCRKLEEGSSFEWALETVYVRFKNIEELNKSWEKFLNK